MDLLELLNALPTAARSRWYGMAIALLMGVLLGLWLESRWFARSGRAGSWGVVRTVSLFAAVLAVLSVWVPVKAVSGPMALAVFYAAGLTVAPLIWFGSHLLVGPRLSPQLSHGESVALGVSGLLLLLVLPGAAWQLAHQALQAEVRGIGNTPVLPSDTAPLAHSVGPARRWQLPRLGELWTQTLSAPPDVRLVRVQRFSAGQWRDTTDTSQPDFCIHSQDLHLAWLAEAPATAWRLHWTDTAGRLQMSVFTAEPTAFQGTPAQPFTVTFRDDGFDLPVPMARHLAHVARGREADGRWQYVALSGVHEPRANARDNCLMPGLSQPPTPARPTVQAVGLMFGPANGLATLVDFERPAQVR